MNEINKLISIGSNCIGTDIIHFAGLRVPSPVDNFSGFSIKNSDLLFSGKLKNVLFKEKYKIRWSTEFEKEKYNYFDKVFSFREDFHIVHNDFESKNFQKSIKIRIRNFKKYYNLSRENKNLWYIYSLDSCDATLDEDFLKTIKNKLPECCRTKLICLGIREKNKLFKDFFPYLEFNESEYIWHDVRIAKYILNEYERSFEIKFNFGY